MTDSSIKEHKYLVLHRSRRSWNVTEFLCCCTTTKPEEFDLHLVPSAERPPITGYHMNHEPKRQMKSQDPSTSDEDSNFEAPVQDPGVSDVMGALLELERTISTARAALLPIFFPGKLAYEPDRLLSIREKRFLKLAFRKLGNSVNGNNTSGCH